MKTILITGATDGIGHATASKLAEAGHSLILHGRNPDKLAKTARALQATGAQIHTAEADFSDLAQVAAMADRVAQQHPRIDALINNAGVFKTATPVTPDGRDLRFVVNTFASALLTLKLLPVIPPEGRIVHLSSAAQAPVDLTALKGGKRLGDMDAYAQSKLAITLWNQHFATQHPGGPVSIAVNPGSLLATRMVREGFGTSGNDISIGTDILIRAALAEEFAPASGRYFDNDARRFGPSHPAGLARQVSEAINAELEHMGV